MKLNVTGVETVEITDPQGLSNPPANQGIPIQQQKRPAPMTPNSGPFPGLIEPFPLSPSPISPAPNPFRPPTTRGGPMAVYEHREDIMDRWQRGATGDPPGSVLETTDGARWARGLQANFRAAMESKGNGNGDKQYNA